MKVSVVIPSYNREKILAYTLNSLCRQVHIDSSDMEVIVSDDGSSDNTEGLVNSYRNRLDIKYLFQEDKGYRVALARNRAIAEAKNEVIVLLDSGVAASSECIGQHLKMHSSKESRRLVVGYIYGYNYTLQEKDLNEDFDFENPDRTIIKLQAKGAYLDIREENYLAVDGKLVRLPAPWALFWTTNVSFTKRFFNEVSGFNEKFEGWGVEDIELGYRFYKAGGEYALGRYAAGVHFPHEREIESNKRSNQLNRRLFLKLHDDAVVQRYMNSTALKINLELLAELEEKSSEIKHSGLYEI